MVYKLRIRGLVTQAPDDYNINCLKTEVDLSSVESFPVESGDASDFICPNCEIKLNDRKVDTGTKRRVSLIEPSA